MNNIIRIQNWPYASDIPFIDFTINDVIFHMYSNLSRQFYYYTNITHSESDLLMLPEFIFVFSNSITELQITSSNGCTLELHSANDVNISIKITEQDAKQIKQLLIDDLLSHHYTAINEMTVHVKFIGQYPVYKTRQIIYQNKFIDDNDVLR